MQRGKTIDEVLVIPGAHQGPVPLHPQRGTPRGHQRKTRGVLAQQPAGARLGFF
jgi:hypothetical protein